MQDLAFYEAGCHGVRGVRSGLVPVRRLLRRLLRPIFLRQVELLQKMIDRLDAGEASLHSMRDQVDSLTLRQDEVDERVETVMAFGWDYVAMVRRLAVIEDQLVSLTGQAMPSTDDGETQPSILFPSHEPVPEARSRVC